jgi:predicted DNA binding CopG/RHH family protein|tara:strand:- start:702 stop:866 length:165 start_codon:yes stop_codon:yes gene_type:complete
MVSYTNKIEDMDEQILVKFKKQSYEQIVKKAKAQGLPKSTWVRFITLKAIADEI